MNWLLASALPQLSNQSFLYVEPVFDDSREDRHDRGVASAENVRQWHIEALYGLSGSPSKTEV